MLLQTNRLNPVIAEDARQRDAACYDEPLIARLRERDPQAFDQMVIDQAPRIQRLVSRLLGWESDCDDVVQEVFMAAWQKIDRFRGDADLTSWLYAIAINHCRKQRRKRGRWSQVFRRLCEQQRGPEEREAASSSEESDPGVAAIHAAINKLDQRDREVIVLCSLESRSTDDVGTLLGIRKNTVEVRLHRARKRLKQILKNGFEASKD